jgi:hypothetical protein
MLMTEATLTLKGAHEIIAGASSTARDTIAVVNVTTDFLSRRLCLFKARQA